VLEWWYAGVVVWCAGVVVCWCGGVLEWWYAGVVVCWCGGVLEWWYAGVVVPRNAVTDGHCEIKGKYTSVRTDTPMAPVIPKLRNCLVQPWLKEPVAAQWVGTFSAFCEHEETF